MTSDRPGLSWPMVEDAIPVIHRHILAVGAGSSNKMDLFLYSRGGQSDVPWALVSMFREYCQQGSFSVLVPYRAHSAATVVALGADEIVMSRKAELGPIDITIRGGPYNPTEKDSHQRLPVSVEDVRGYFSLMREVGCGRPDEVMRGFELLTNHVHPLALGNVNRLLGETKLVALGLLRSRANPFAEDENERIVKRVSSEVYSHNHTINRTEAVEYIGLKHVKLAEDVGIADELWELYEAYRELFGLEEVFNPEEYLALNDLDEHTWQGLKLACVDLHCSGRSCQAGLRGSRARIQEVSPSG